jgi:hypothetical protein
MGGGEYYFLVDDVHEVNFNEDAIFTLGPLGDRMSE